jgi:hypothetical protein
MVGTDVTIGQNQPLTSILLILESGDISTEMGSDICQVMICFLAKVVWRVRGSTLGGRRFIYPEAQSH